MLNFCSGNNRKTTRKRPELVRPGQAAKKMHPISRIDLAAFLSSTVVSSLVMLHYC